MEQISRKTKIVATLGPASSSEEIIRKLTETGTNVFRLNLSHGTRDAHEKNAGIIRHVQEETGIDVAIMIDLQGPKIRIGSFENRSITLLPGEKFRLDLDRSPGDISRVCLPHPEIIEALLPGAEVLLDDGKLKLEVTDNNGHSVETVAVNGGELSDRKGVSVPGVILPINAITDKDMADIEILRKIDADWLAVSFVQTARDIALAREIAGPNINILAKIEKPAAVDHIDSILESADAIMVARGDLGVEIPFESVPHAQKLLINAARAHNKPCIVATQMLESMITCHRPTRAEVSDVACAVLDGADAVMLSAETASGKYPVEAVTTMDKIVTRAERDRKDRLPAAICNANHIAEAVSVIASRDNVRAIAVFTETGNSVNIIAAARPDANIMALTTDKRVGMKLCMTWGAIPVIVNETFEFSQAIQIAQKNIAQRFDIEDGQEIIVVAGVPPNAADQINLIHIFQVDRKAVH